MFRCGNTSVCVPQRFVCNNHRDCPHGEDESIYTCVDFHGKEYFNDLLKVNAVSKNPNYNNCGLTGMPEGCMCRNHTWLFCKALGLTEVPQDVASNVTRMVFSNNSIQNLTEDSFSRYNLDLISLSWNGISELQPGVFTCQTHMEKLILSHNELRYLDPNLLLGLRALERLYVSNNQLQAAPLHGLRELTALSWLDLSNNNLTLEDDVFPPLPELRVLWLEHNAITRLDRDLLQGLSGLISLKLQWNSISWVHEDAFASQTELKELLLSHNQLRTLPGHVFRPLSGLASLKLASNPFELVPSQLFSGVTNLSSLDLQEIELEHLDVEMFQNLRELKFVYLKTFYYCTYAPHVPSCRPNTDGVSSSKHLLAHPTLRATVWLVGALTFLGNALVLWGRFSDRDENRELSFVIRNLAVSDLLMGIYLFVIGVQDTQFRDHYGSKAHHWMSSWPCTIVGMLAMTSSEVSVLILVFLSVERFLLIAIPFGGHRKLSMRIACRSLGLIWVAGVCLAVIPAVHWRHSTRFYGTNGMCFPLHIDDPFLLGWQYSAFVILGVNTTGLLLIALLYTGMFVSIWRTRHATPISSLRDLEFIVRFFFIVLTDAGCWAPIIALKLLAMCRVHIPGDLYAWVVVFILPVNSAVNPLLYTFTTPRYRSQLGRMGLRRFGLGLGLLGLGRMGRSHSTQSSLVARRHSTVDTEYSSHRNMMCTLVNKKKATPLDLFPNMSLPSSARQTLGQK